MAIKVPSKLKQAAQKKLVAVKSAKAKKVETPKVEEPVVVAPVVETKVAETASNVVKLVLPFRAESKTYLEVEIAGQVRWLQKTSLVEFSKVNDQQVRVTMTKAQARRRGLLAA